jgi:hypothetical protein
MISICYKIADAVNLGSPFLWQSSSSSSSSLSDFNRSVSTKAKVADASVTAALAAGAAYSDQVGWVAK